MTDDLIDRAKAALEGVTEGEWVQSEYAGVIFVDCNTSYIAQFSGLDDTSDANEPRENARFIAASRQLVPDLIAALEARDARIAELERDVAAVLRREDDANVSAFNHLRRAADAEARVKVLEDALNIIDLTIDANSELFTSGADLLLNIQDRIARARAALEGEKT